MPFSLRVPHVSPSSSSSSPGSESGAHLVATDGRPLPLEHVRLDCEAGGGLARSVLHQRFRNTTSETLEVTYLLPLPNDGAVSGYGFTLRGVKTRGVVEAKQQARERYEEALLQGKSAALLEQSRSNLFRQELGNLPAGEVIEIEVTVDHPLSWIDGGWELRFPTVVAPRYQSGEERSPSVPIALVDEQAEARDISASHELCLHVSDAITGAPSSPSHALQVTSSQETTQIAFENARLDRDVVVRWGVAQPEVGARVETARAAEGNARAALQYGLLTLVPPSAATRAVPRDLIVLLDTSGSMQGEPLAQAVRVVSALVQSLSENDRLELIEFGTQPRRWKSSAVAATAAEKKDALSWLKKLRASGGTEMRAGIEAALSSLRDGALRQVILVSDGQIGFESQILSQLAKHLPASCRFHCLGVGHAANAALLVPAARAGRGRCMIVAPGEDAEPACKRMLAHTAAPQVVKLSVSGGALASAPERVQDLYAGAPLQLALALRAGGGTLEVHGETAEGPYSTSLTVAPREAGSGSARLLALYARERIEDVELALAAGTCQLAEADREIEALGVDFQVASRLTSWVAVSENVSVDGTHATRRVEQPHVLAAGMSAEGLGLRAPMAFASVPTSALFAGVAVAGAAPPSMRSRAMFGAPPASAAPPSAKAETSLFARVKRVFSSGSEPGELSEPVHSMADFRSLQDIVELRGKIRIHNEQRLAITIELPRALTWELPARVSVQLADGSVVELDVERSASTQSGQLQAGQSVRLVCRLQAPLATAPETLFFEQPHDARWVVTLEA